MSRFARLALLTSSIVALSAAPTAAFAQATMTFSPACTGSAFVGRGTTYTEAGFSITAAGTLASWCTGAPSYAGPGIFLDQIGGNGSLTKVGGGTFTVNSIDLANVFFGSFSAQSYTFTGNLFGGGTVSETFTIAAQSGTPSFATFTFAPTFTNLTSLSLAQQDAEFYQFSNVQLDATTVTPEPASLALLATGLIGVAAVRRKRRS